MGIKKYNPTSPGRRFQTVSDFSDITKDTPFKPLLRPIKKTGGRNNSRCVTAWHRGGEKEFSGSSISRGKRLVFQQKLKL